MTAVGSAAVIYLRISQDRTGLEAGVTRQREDCERRCKDRGWRVVAVEADNDKSAYRPGRRPGFNAAVARVDHGEAHVLVAWALDRLQRNKRDELHLYEVCRARTAVISLVNGPELDLSTATGRLVADQLGSIARYEVELKADRQRRAQRQAAEGGRRVGGRRPFGYGPDGTTVREVEAAAVRDGYTALLSGMSLAEIARDWNARGLPTGQGSAWAHSTVRHVLANPRNAGLRRYGDERKAGQLWRGEIVRDAVWPALVDEPTWRAAVDLLVDPSRQTAPRSARALLTGLALCGRAGCGSPVHGGRTVDGVRVYRCRAAYGHLARQAAPADLRVEAATVERLARADAVELLVDRGRPDVDRLRGEAVSLRARLDSLAADWADGTLTGSQLRTATERIRARLAAVDAELADAGRVDVLGGLVGADDVQRTWETLPMARQRVVVDTLMTVVLLPPGRGRRRFDPDTVQIRWRQP